MKIVRTILTFLLLTALATGGIVALDNSRVKQESLLLKEESLDKDVAYTEWEIMILALIQQESQFNIMAKGTKEDLGILQITPIYVEEVNRILGDQKYSHIDALDPTKSIEMFNIYQNAKNPKHDILKAIQLHNPKAGSSYVISVRKRMDNLKEIFTSI